MIQSFDNGNRLTMFIGCAIPYLVETGHLQIPTSYLRFSHITHYGTNGALPTKSSAKWLAPKTKKSIGEYFSTHNYHRHHGVVLPPGGGWKWLK
jgi:hypothetical protein